MSVTILGGGLSTSPAATRGQMVERWQNRHSQFEKLNAQVNAAALVEEFLDDLKSFSEENDDEPLTLEQAAEMSGYSKDHLGRLIRDGTIPNAGRFRSPRIRRGGLPKRPKASVARSAGGGYDPSAYAQKLLSRRKGGAHGLS